jgi:hypothetical protein
LPSVAAQVLDHVVDKDEVEGVPHSGDRVRDVGDLEASAIDDRCGRFLLGLMDRGRREIHAEGVESALGQEQRVVPAAAPEVDRSSAVGWSQGSSVDQRSELGADASVPAPLPPCRADPVEQVVDGATRQGPILVSGCRKG